MNIPLRLAFFREYQHWELQDVAKELGIDIEDYEKLENGKAKMDGVMAQKLSDLYHAPMELFIIDDTPHYQQADVLYTNCTFSGSGSSGYVNHQYNDQGIDLLFASKNEEINSLKQQIEELRRQNNKLMEIIAVRVAELG